MGIIFRDNVGEVLLAASRVLQACNDAEKVEAMACLGGLRLAAT